MLNAGLTERRPSRDRHNTQCILQFRLMYLKNDYFNNISKVAFNDKRGFGRHTFLVDAYLHSQQVCVYKTLPKCFCPMAVKDATLYLFFFKHSCNSCDLLTFKNVLSM